MLGVLGAEVSSLRIVPVAAAVPITAPELGEVSVTVKPSLASTVVSPETGMVMVLLVSPAPKLTMPLGSALPVKSLAVAGLAPEPETAQLAVCATDVSPDLVTVKVNAVLPDCPSSLVASAAAMASEASSLRIVPVAVAVPVTAPELGLVSETVNPSLASTLVSPETGMVTVLLVSPAPKLTMPLGSALPLKSLAEAGLAPEPVTAQLAVCATDVSPDLVMVKVKAVLPD